MVTFCCNIIYIDTVYILSVSSWLILAVSCLDDMMMSWWYVVQGGILGLSLQPSLTVLISTTLLLFSKWQHYYASDLSDDLNLGPGILFLLCLFAICKIVLLYHQNCLPAVSAIIPTVWVNEVGLKKGWGPVNVSSIVWRQKGISHKNCTSYPTWNCILPSTPHISLSSPSPVCEGHDEMVLKKMWNVLVCSWRIHRSETNGDGESKGKARFPLPKFTTRVHGPSTRPVNSGAFFDTRQLGPSTRVSKNAPEFTGRQLGPWTRAVNSGSGNWA